MRYCSQKGRTTQAKPLPITRFNSNKMSMNNNHISYVEFKAKDLEMIKEFYKKTFDWIFTDYGPTYTSFSDSGLNGGFEKSEEEVMNGALVVLYHESLESIRDRVIEFKGIISRDIFSFPGGRRFHFTDPGGNELGVWSDK